MLQTQDFYSEIKVLTQILLRISEEKIGGWGLWFVPFECFMETTPCAIDNYELDPMVWVDPLRTE